MTIKTSFGSLYIPAGIYSFNGFSYIVNENKILKSKAYYPNLFDVIYCVNDSSIGCIVELELRGLVRNMLMK